MASLATGSTNGRAGHCQQTRAVRPTNNSFDQLRAAPIPWMRSRI